jgi:hypothetical protein
MRTKEAIPRVLPQGSGRARSCCPPGQFDYVIEGAMIGGFALVAVPAQYRVTGVMNFIVSYDGVVYQKDLGPDSFDIVKKWSAITRIRPGIARTTKSSLTRSVNGLRRRNTGLRLEDLGLGVGLVHDGWCN